MAATMAADRADAGNVVEQRRGGALPGRSIPDETTIVDNGGVTSTKLDDAMDCSRRIEREGRGERETVEKERGAAQLQRGGALAHGQRLVATGRGRRFAGDAKARTVGAAASQRGDRCVGEPADEWQQLGAVRVNSGDGEWLHWRGFGGAPALWHLPAARHAAATVDQRDAKELINGGSGGAGKRREATAARWCLAEPIDPR
ncbi:hypothetical protein Scep_026612 [Stephania cephalantha]|uniref:Uncharacterized protein n=1 Tax=Stephania cephalantha TaxID=152367 RepID=A0AAP0HNC0_9MAGN